MIEIKYLNGEIKIFHDGREFDRISLMNHLSGNGHELEIASFAVPKEVYQQCSEISNEIYEFFERRKRIQEKRRQYQK